MTLKGDYISKKIQTLKKKMFFCIYSRGYLAKMKLFRHLVSDPGSDEENSQVPPNNIRVRTTFERNLFMEIVSDTIIIYVFFVITENRRYGDGICTVYDGCMIWFEAIK